MQNLNEKRVYLYKANFLTSSKHILVEVIYACDGLPINLPSEYFRVC